MNAGIATTAISSPDEYRIAVNRVLDEVNAVEVLTGFSRVIVKPNMVNGSPPQVTTDVRCVMAVVEYLKGRIEAEIVVADGSGEGSTLDNRKSQIHAVDEDQAVADLMLYIRPHLTIIDAIEGQVGGHLSGRCPNPPIGRIIAGTDVVAADREAARLLGHDPNSIRHLSLAAQFL